MAQLGPGAAVAGTESSAGEPTLPAGRVCKGNCAMRNNKA